MARTLIEGETIRLRVPPVKLGEGAFGAVYRAEFREAHDSPFWHPCALKVLNAADAGALDGELNALAALPPHPNIVRLLGKTRTDTRVGIATELLPGGSLQKKLDECTRLNQPPSTEMRLRWCLGVAAGLAVMHERGLVHGDIKTPNVMLDSEGPTAGAKLIVRGECGPDPPPPLRHLTLSTLPALHTGLWAG
jgi:serine/threonine protein kinase